jgi:hypothetical protein
MNFQPQKSRQRNLLLDALPTEECKRLSPNLEWVTLKLGQVLHESGAGLDHVYFPSDCIISLLYVMENGESAEIAIVGNEGMVGISLFMGGETTTSRAVVQSSGRAFRLAKSVMNEEFQRTGLVYANIADCGVQSPSFGTTAALPLAVVKHRPSARRQIDHDTVAYRRYVGRAKRRRYRSGGQASIGGSN